MSALEHRAIARPAYVRPALGLRVINRVAEIFRAWRNRREIHKLEDMSDAQLADIGLMRGDLRSAWDAPLGADPTERLGAISEARMRAYEAAARRVT